MKNSTPSPGSLEYFGKMFDPAQFRKYSSAPLPKKVDRPKVGRLLAVFEGGQTQIVLENMPFPLLQVRKKQLEGNYKGAKLLITY